MIANEPFPQAHILIALRNSEITFYPTGSRFFKTAKEDSDYDFFISDEDDPKVRTFLLNLGFTEVHSIYFDDNTILVYRHDSGIDIQVVRDARLKELVQQLLYKLGIHNPTMKQWNVAYALLQHHIGT